MTSHPLLFQWNLRAELAERAAAEGAPRTLDDLPDRRLDALAEAGFTWVWALGVWELGPRSRAVTLSLPGIWRETAAALPDFSEDDVAGSPFAIRSYRVAARFGGEQALARFRKRLHARGLRLMVDFVPNHVGLDHELVETPELLIRGDSARLEAAPGCWTRVETPSGPRVLAHGRDPYFPGWTDTLQLDYRHPALQDRMAGELAGIATRADGVRVDMAMLVLPEVFERTWGDASPPAEGPDPRSFWEHALPRAREANPEFELMAEVYWGLEGRLLDLGFDHAYDKELYDRLRDHDGPGIRRHLEATASRAPALARFVENHDEERVRVAMPGGQDRAAAVAALTLPGLRLVHDGQTQGRTRRASVHLARRSPEKPDSGRREFYRKLLAQAASPPLAGGEWRPSSPRPAWEDNGSFEQFLAWSWSRPDGARLVVVNLSPAHGQCYLDLPLRAYPRASRLRFRDRLGPDVFDRDAAELAERGMYFDMPAWGVHLFEVMALDRGES